MLAAALLAGCRTAGYYGQAIRGQWQILAGRQPIPKVLDDPAAGESLKQRLQLVTRIRQFAERELKLPANGHYQSYVDVGRRHVVWNVYAAPEFSLEAKTWWYPVVGRLKYRGYFSEAGARECAARLARQGYDTYVGGVDAYSTLGWFRDPVLNTFIHYPEEELAGVIFHELAHQKLFCAGDTDFNEAFATVVEETGVRRWLQSAGPPELARRHEESLRFEDAFQRLLAQTRQQLQELYAARPGRGGENGADADESTLAARRRRKAEIFSALQNDYARLRAHWPTATHRDRWMTSHLNNAKLASQDAYYRLVPGFRRLWEGQGNDPEAFHRAAGSLAHLPKAERHRRLQSLEDNSR